jgi:hypothetical protein
MPYINNEQRVKFLPSIQDIVNEIESEGELNYVITKLCKEYVKRKGLPKYKDYNEVVGVMACLLLEFYRTEVSPYEEKKRKENGNV